MHVHNHGPSVLDPARINDTVPGSVAFVLLAILATVFIPPVNAQLSADPRTGAALGSLQVGSESTLSVSAPPKCAPAHKYSPEENQAAADRALCCLKQQGKRWVLGVELGEPLPADKGGVSTAGATHVHILNVLRGLPAEKAGMEYGDVVTHVNGRTVSQNKEFLEAINNSKGKMKLRIERDGKVLTKTIRLKKLQ